MLSDEEKKGIDFFEKSFKKKIPPYWYDDTISNIEEKIKIILNLIEKQSKEIEELKEKNKPQPDCAEPTEKTEEMVNMRWVNHKYISKDKILELLGIEEETDNKKILSLLQTLVDENNRLEDIEDKKVQIEYNNVFNKGVKSVEDKIKTKIEESELLIDNSQGCMSNEDLYKEFGKIEFGKSLLEKE